MRRLCGISVSNCLLDYLAPGMHACQSKESTDGQIIVMMHNTHSWSHDFATCDLKHCIRSTVALVQRISFFSCLFLTLTH